MSFISSHPGVYAWDVHSYESDLDAGGPGEVLPPLHPTEAVQPSALPQLLSYTQVLSSFLWENDSIAKRKSSSC